MCTGRVSDLQNRLASIIILIVRRARATAALRILRYKYNARAVKQNDRLNICQGDPAPGQRAPLETSVNVSAEATYLVDCTESV